MNDACRVDFRKMNSESKCNSIDDHILKLLQKNMYFDKINYFYFTDTFLPLYKKVQYSFLKF